MTIMRTLLATFVLLLITACLGDRATTVRVHDDYLEFNGEDTSHSKLQQQLAATPDKSRLVIESHPCTNDSRVDEIVEMAKSAGFENLDMESFGSDAGGSCH